MKGIGPSVIRAFGKAFRALENLDNSSFADNNLSLD